MICRRKNGTPFRNGKAFIARTLNVFKQQQKGLLVKLPSVHISRSSQTYVSLDANRNNKLIVVEFEYVIKGCLANQLPVDWV